MDKGFRLPPQVWPRLDPTGQRELSSFSMDVANFIGVNNNDHKRWETIPDPMLGS